MFRYYDGREVVQGDEVLAANQRAYVERIFYPGNKDACDWCCGDTGGILLNFENGDLHLWPIPNEDLELIGRWPGGEQDPSP